MIGTQVNRCLELSLAMIGRASRDRSRIVLRECVFVDGECRLVGQTEGSQAGRHTDWMCLLALLGVERRSAGSVLRMVIVQLSKVEIEMVGERLRGLQTGLESSSVVGEVVGEVQRTLQDFGKARRTFGHGLRLQLLPVDSELHLLLAEFFLDV
jgi:hypothetical protein